MHPRERVLGVAALLDKKGKPYPPRLIIEANKLGIPVIGIGAGSDVDGQVLVTHDLVGLTTEFNPRFLRRYVDLNEIMTKAIKNYIKDVKNIDFPNQDEQY